MEWDETGKIAETYGTNFQIKYVVFDTNTWLLELPFIENLIKSDQCIVYITQILLDELDAKKRDDNVGYQARNASRLIDTYSKGKASLQVEAAGLNFQGLLDVQCNDDKFLNSCLYLCGLNKPTIFVTYLLRIKARSCNIYAYDTEDFKSAISL